MRRMVARLLSVIWCAWLAAMLLTGCDMGRPPAVQAAGGAAARPSRVVRKGALLLGSPDVMALEAAVQASQWPGALIVGEAPLEQLRRKKCEAVLLGRDPNPVELEGLVDHVIALDAVCIVVDANSFKGGVFSIRGMGPVSYTDGLRNLTRAEVIEVFQNAARRPGDPFWFWPGAYRVGEPMVDPKTGKTIRNKQSGQVEYDLVDKPLLLMIRKAYPVGQFDVQTVLFEALDLDPAWVGEGKPLEVLTYASEEEMLAKEYDPMNAGPFVPGSGAHRFKMAFASRRTTLAAIEHFMPLRALAIDGLDPLKDEQAIHSGAYPFARRIHLITRENPSPQAQDLAEFLLSPEGQRHIAAAGYLALQD